MTIPAVEFASDASGTWGCGAWQWPQGCDKGIAFKELFAVYISAAVWGKKRRGRHIRAHCNNEAVVYMMGSRASRNPDLLHLLRCLFFIEEQGGFSLSVVHIVGIANDLADDLSRDRLSSFHLKVPTVQPLPTPPTPIIPGTPPGHGWELDFSSSILYVRTGLFN